MKRVGLASLVGLIAIVVAVGLMAFQPNVQAASAPKGNAQVDLLIELGTDGTVPNTMADMIRVVRENGTFQVDSFFDISYVSNIGSSGLDGYTFTVDSFFDVEYRVSSFDTEMVSLSLSASPLIFGDPDFDLFGDPDFDVRALDAVITAVGKAGGHVHYGHVTVLK